MKKALFYVCGAIIILLSAKYIVYFVDHKSNDWMIGTWNQECASEYCPNIYLKRFGKYYYFYDYHEGKYKLSIFCTYEDKCFKDSKDNTPIGCIDDTGKLYFQGESYYKDN